jgi:hypothetical protein
VTAVQLAASFVGAAISAAVGIIVWRLQRRIDKAEINRGEVERSRKKNEVLLIKSSRAAIALGEATAMAIKNGKCNGETEKALAYAREIKHEQKDFLYEQGVRAMY